MSCSISSVTAAHETSAAQKSATPPTPAPAKPAAQPEDTVSLSSAARAALAASDDNEPGA